MENPIIDLIKLSQLRDSVSLVDLIKMFDPLLKKYSKKLNYEEAYYDLRFEFINTIYKLNTKNLEILSDGQIINYITKIIYHHYINQSKKIRSNVKPFVFSEMSDQMVSIIDDKLAVEDQKKDYGIEYALRNLNIHRNKIRSDSINYATLFPSLLPSDKSATPHFHQVQSTRTLK
jgi:hypothetical protein